MSRIRFDFHELPPEAEALRGDVREFLAEEMPGVTAAQRSYTWSGWNEDFSRKLGERGWIGLTWPKQYGGHERSALERYVLLEELLTAGAPVAAHWVADRQSGPLILKFGTEEQRERLIPPICRGESYFCIGMSEPDSGSDLASIRARATKTDGGWLVNGTKLWTTGAHHCHYMIALVRTSIEEGKRHAGMSQLLIDMKEPGVTIRPIRDLVGNNHFNEVVFQDAFVPENMLIGEEGGGWGQVMAELANERSGPERYLSCYPLLRELIGALPKPWGPRERVAIGRQVAHLATLRRMSIGVAGMLQAGENPTVEASLVKDVGGVFEQALPNLAQDLLPVEPRTDEEATDFQQVLAHLTQNAPAFSLRGGTREILRGIIARGLGLR